jgi:hypothetical protein
MRLWDILVKKKDQKPINRKHIHAAIMNDIFIANGVFKECEAMTISNDFVEVFRAIFVMNEENRPEQLKFECLTNEEIIDGIGHYLFALGEELCECGGNLDDVSEGAAGDELFTTTIDSKHDALKHSVAVIATGDTSSELYTTYRERYAGKDVSGVYILRAWFLSTLGRLHGVEKIQEMIRLSRDVEVDDNA